jgi:hypothetical protein
MDDRKDAPLNTREFVIKWHATVDQHLVTKLSDALEQLAPNVLDGPALAPAQSRLLAQQMVTALHLAADANGGVPEAVDYLVQVAAEAAGR